MEKKLETILTGYHQQMVTDLSHLLTFDTTKDVAAPGAPFGSGIGEALDSVLALTASWGLPGTNLEGYVGLVDYGPANGEQVGVLCHVDTVPVGNGWTKPPFGGQVVDGKIYGRGAVDDKGPLIASLYALRAIKESGLPVKRQVRFIVGTDEENGFGCMDYFLARCRPPEFGFTPDAHFPLIYGEKGIVHVDLNFKRELPDGELGEIVLSELKGGVGCNVIPDYAEATLVLSESGFQQLTAAWQSFAEREPIELQHGRVIAHGKTAHGSTPEKGENAIVLLWRFLHTLPLDDTSAKLVADCLQLFGEDMDGHGLHVDATDQYGCTSLAPTMTRFAEGQGFVHLDIRFPVTLRGHYFLKKITERGREFGMTIGEWECKEPLFVDPERPFLQQLLRSYRAVTGDQSEPLVIGGGTYARAFTDFVGFGPTFAEEVELSHQADECIGCDKLLYLSKIYAQALYDLLNY